MRWLLLLYGLTFGLKPLTQTINGIQLTTEKEFQSLSNNTDDYCGAASLNEKFSNQNRDSSIFYLDLAQKFAQQCYNFELRANLNYSLANNLLKVDRWELSLKHYLKALDAYSILDEKTQMAYCYVGIGNCFKKLNKYAFALKSYNVADYYFQQMENFEGMAMVDVRMASIYKRVGRFEEAKLKYRSGIKAFKQLGDSEMVYDMTFNLGNIFKTEEKYDSAFYCYHKSLNARLKEKVNLKVGFAYQNLANLHEEVGNLDSAIWYVEKSIENKNEFGDSSLLISDHVIYGNILMLKEAYNEAIFKYEMARKISQEFNIRDIGYDISVELGKAYYHLKDYKESSENFMLFLQQKDSFETNNSIFEIENGLIKYESYQDSVETEKLKLNNELERIKRQNQQLSDQSIQSQLYFTVGILSLLVLMLGLLFISFRKRLKQTREHREVLAEQNDELKRTLVSKEEKETLLKEIHHRVKNNLQIISSLVRLQSGYIDKTNFKERLNEIENRISSMALVHEKLYQSNDLSKLEVKSYIRDLSINILESYQTRKKVKFVFDIDSSEFNIDTLIPIGLILNETISNALKHAFKELEEGIITIQVKSTARGETTMLIKDNGIGTDLSIDELKEDSLGMDLIFSLTDQLDGTLDVSTKNGFEYRFTFPLLA